jgi:hypothetical protein
LLCAKEEENGDDDDDGDVVWIKVSINKVDTTGMVASSITDIFCFFMFLKPLKSK